MNDLVKTGIAIDNWKIKLFRKRLKKAGHQFNVVHNCPTPECKLIQIDTTEPLKLQKLVEEIQNECARSRCTTH